MVPNLIFSTYFYGVLLLPVAQSYISHGATRAWQGNRYQYLRLNRKTVYASMKQRLLLEIRHHKTAIASESNQDNFYTDNENEDEDDEYDDELEEKPLDTFESFQDYTYDVGDEEGSFLEYMQLEDIMGDIEKAIEPNTLSEYFSVGMFDPDDDSLDEQTMQQILSLPDDIEPEDMEDLERLFTEQGWELLDYDEKGGVTTFERPIRGNETTLYQSNMRRKVPSPLEQALLQGVVPADAGVGSLVLPGDYGFDPLNLSTKDYFKQTQSFVLGLLPLAHDNDYIDRDGAYQPYSDSQRPSALILRDYREAEIRHGRLAMLASIIWPLQEIIDRLFIPYTFGTTTLIYGGPTLPFLSLFMTFMMLLLGYLDVYAQSIKAEYTGNAFLPGECFWDPLSILEGATDETKRIFQARELFFGRIAMIAVLSYILQEAVTHSPLITLPWNIALFEPAYEIPTIQSWLDSNFAGIEVPSGDDFSITEGTDIDDD